MLLLILVKITKVRYSAGTINLVLSKNYFLINTLRRRPIKFMHSLKRLKNIF